MIKNIDDLRNEIQRLEVAKQEQVILLKQRFSSPSAIFSTVLSVIPGGSLISTDFIKTASRILLPLLLNKTLFRRSSFLTKSIIGLVSQKAAEFVNEDTVGGIFGKVKSFIAGIGKKKKANYPDPRIPEDSEVS